MGLRSKQPSPRKRLKFGLLIQNYPLFFFRHHVESLTISAISNFKSILFLLMTVYSVLQNSLQKTFFCVCDTHSATSLCEGHFLLCDEEDEENVMMVDRDVYIYVYLWFITLPGTDNFVYVCPLKETLL